MLGLGMWVDVPDGRKTIGHPSPADEFCSAQISFCKNCCTSPRNLRSSRDRLRKAMFSASSHPMGLKLPTPIPEDSDLIGSAPSVRIPTGAFFSIRTTAEILGGRPNGHRVS